MRERHVCAREERGRSVKRSTAHANHHGGVGDGGIGSSCRVNPFDRALFQSRGVQFARQSPISTARFMALTPVFATCSGLPTIPKNFEISVVM